MGKDDCFGEKMRQKMRNSADLLYLIIFTTVFLQAGRNMWRQSPASYVILIGILMLLIFVYRKTKYQFLPELNYRKAWVVLQILSVFLMLTEMKMMELKLSWDWQQVITTAWQYAVCGGEDVNLKYFAAYPNNQFWTVCLAVFFKVIHKICSVTSLRFYKWMSMLLAGCMTQFSLWLIYQTARMHFNEKKAFLTGCFGLFFLPVYLYAMLAYTDVPGMLLTALILFLYSGAKKSEKKYLIYVHVALTGCMAALALKIKVTVFILVIAIAIGELVAVKNVKRFLAGLLVMAASAGVTMGCAEMLNSHIMVIDQKMQDRYEFPVTHWIMMGLKKNGGYTASDVEYTKKYTSYEEKKDANIRKIRKRIAAYGPQGLVRHVFAEKMDYTWCNSCLAGDYYAAKYPYEQNYVWNLLSKDGTYHQAVLLYTWPYYMLLLAGILLSAVRSLRDHTEGSSFFFICRVSLTGLFLFLAIWECNSRYLVSFIPVLILTAGNGVSGASSGNALSEKSES